MSGIGCAIRRSLVTRASVPRACRWRGSVRRLVVIDESAFAVKSKRIVRDRARVMVVVREHLGRGGRTAKGSEVQFEDLAQEF